MDTDRSARLAAQHNRVKANAYQRAYQRLRDAHRGEFDAYYADERRMVGIL
jgi:hypothetical protein